VNTVQTVDQLPGYGEPARRRAPSLGQLTYAKEAMTVALLALTFLWLVPRLVRAPGSTLEGLAKRVAGARP
jgi:hypothetical protein